MSGPLEDLVAFVQRFYAANLGCSKGVVAEATAQRFGLARVRSLYVGPLFSIRFSVAGGSGLSNTILSLSALKTSRRASGNPVHSSRGSSGIPPR